MGQISDIKDAIRTLIEDLGLGEQDKYAELGQLISVLKEGKGSISIESVNLTPEDTIENFLMTVGDYEGEDLNGLDRKELRELVLEVIDTL